MATNPKRSMLLCGALLALAGYVPFPAAAAGMPEPVTSADRPAPIVLAQASSSRVRADRAVLRGGPYPAFQRGVREAAREGPEALRRYIWRTRMIYNFYFPDFVED